MYPTIGHFIFPITSYGVCLSLAFFAGIRMGISVGAVLGFSIDEIIDIALWFLFSAIFGARLLYIVLYPSEFTDIKSMFMLTSGGLVFFGGFLATMTAVIVWAKIKKRRLRDLGDLIAPCLALGHSIGRIGCFLNGCCYGTRTTICLGMVFPNLNDNIHRHPTQLYESFFLFIICLISLWNIKLRKKGIIPDGSVWGIYVLSYSIFRFFVEFIRDDDRGNFFLAKYLSFSQAISILGFIFSIFWLYFCLRQNNTESRKINELEK
ncbi:MAG: prolipoprotein diacylglyceryl transferase [Candidatus Riflebacteria bacterium]|nr:prolipoprotein diacylglyceryl transferase [Candidatus Riflebacteria bacterium]